MNPQHAGAHAVLFDMDDTLLLTREAKWAHHRHVARHSYGFELDDETLREHWGKPFDEMISRYYRGAASLDHMRAANRASASHFPKQPVPGAVALVERLLDDGHLVGVVTSTNTAAARDDLVACGFPVDRLALVHGADLTGHHKPDPRVFDRAMAELRRLGAGQVHYVGDALMDEEAARAAGLGFVAVTTGLFSAADFPTGTTTIDRLDGLRDALGF